VVLNGTVRRLAVLARHPAADHGHRAAGLHDLAVDADRGSCIVSGGFSIHEDGGGKPMGIALR
jgi:hypothetical protein